MENFISIFLMAILAEQFFPIKSISYREWNFRIRSSGTFRFSKKELLTQLGFFLVVGLLLGAINNNLIFLTLFSIISRISMGFIENKVKIPKLLYNGRKRLLSEASFQILDSDMVAKGVTSAHLIWFRFRPTSSLSLLFLRRIARQPYILIFTAEIYFLTLSLKFSSPQYSVILFFLLWSIASGIIGRMASFGFVKVNYCFKYFVLTVWSFLGMVIFPFMDSVPLFLSAILITVSTVWSGTRRSRPRKVERVTFVDTGFIGVVSPELLYFYLSGMGIPISSAIFYIFTLMP
ncbi:hypothetical protein ACEN17_10110 [Corynebacterium rouxii]|uniref:hypothetical protein n=1 Tax=Corynebacterium rouxii TaxID=2719119 RepID=UPI003CF1F9C3